MKMSKESLDSLFSEYDYSDLYFRETFSDRHPLLYAFVVSTLLFAVLAGAAVLCSIVCPSKDYNHEQDAAARCRSLNGEFSYGNLKCYINGEEV